MPKVASHLRGGIGNQLFQYAIARAMALRHGARVVLDLSWFSDIDPATTTVRSYALAPFELDVQLHNARDARGARSALTRGLVRRVDALLGEAGRRMQGCRLVQEKDFVFDPGVLAMKPPVELRGYWQSEKYFAAAAATLRAEIGMPRRTSEATREMLARVRDANAVAVHVRRGDYVTLASAAEHHGTCGVDYYRRAFELMRGRVGPDAQAFFFSDDPAWVRQNLAFGEHDVVVECNGPDQAHQDLWLMAACRHFVIANSSFSWWGAWLGSFPGKQVIAPSRWFATGPTDTRDLVPASWLRV